MHFAFLTVPSSGQFNVQLATAQQLLNWGHQVTFLSGSTFGKHIHSFQAAQHDVLLAKNIGFISLGEHRSVSDFTPTVRQMLPRMRRKPGDIRSIQACIDIGHPSWQDHHETAKTVREKIDLLDPDMVVVDALSPAMMSGVRLTGRKFYLTIPCSPGLTALSGVDSPHAAAAYRTGLISSIESSYLRLRDYAYCVQKPTFLRKAQRLRNELGLKSFGLRQDVTLLPPYWDDSNCLGGIHFNPAGLYDCPKQPSSVCFVGAGITLPEKEGLTTLSERTATEIWLDDCRDAGAKVIFINMGSMFTWTEKEFQEMIAALCDVHARLNGSVRFLFKAPSQAKANQVSSEKVPDFIHLSAWIEDQQAVYQHPAVQAFVHHGGGNSFNEAVFYGVPQMIISQWLDTHEYGFLVKRFNLGVHCRNPPGIKRKDVRQALLDVLGPKWQSMKDASMQWSIRSRLGGGPSTAAKMLVMNTERTMGHCPSSGFLTPRSKEIQELKSSSCATSVTYG